MKKSESARNKTILLFSFLFLAVLPSIRSYAQPAPPVFPARLDHGLGPSPRATALGDFDEDGDLDLAVLLEQTSQLRVYQGKGDGMFGFLPPSDLNPPLFSTPVPAGPMDIQAGEFGGPGNHLDLLVVSCFAGNISIFLGNGDGTFSLSEQVDTSDDCPKHAVLEDFDLDSNLDVAVAVNGSIPKNPNAKQGFVEIFPGDGTGHLNNSETFPAGNIPESLVATDFDGVPGPDLAVANLGDNTVTIFLNDGSGNLTFTRVSPPSGLPDFSTHRGPADIAAGDLNHDGRNDVATANVFDDSVSILFNNLGGLSEFDGPTRVSVGREPVGIEIANFNGDMLSGTVPLNDIVTANFRSRNVTFLLNNDSTPTPTFLRSDFKVGRNPAGLTLSNGTDTLDGDGAPDLVVANLMSDNISVLNQSLPGEVPDVVFAGDEVTISWGAAPRVPDAAGGGSYNVIRGILADLFDSDHDGVSETYGSCFISGVDPADRFVEDNTSMSPGDGFFYAVTAVSLIGEGTVGFATSTGQRLGLMGSPCPRP